MHELETMAANVVDGFGRPADGDLGFQIQKFERGMLSGASVDKTAPPGVMAE
ncbi:hypothetical protein [Bradyrhizobium sp. ERR14]|uniref:hypothetical protein n=1 Tax=Bradyrhizobium sp. ERR14 TaxID=2663837 RepID=UPI001616614E|nr:hypothetical protein [Bradyrhizobium sp. ERR14]MBB4395162.1 hypothetical protein [Bradyrhizobium sp. ERR14]